MLAKKDHRIRWKLKSALVQRFGSQVHAARALGIRESRLSYLVRGHVQPTESERKALAKALGHRLVYRVFRPAADAENGKGAGLWTNGKRSISIQ